jgi:WD40 repeat protein
MSVDGKVILSGSNDKTVRVWDADTNTEVCKLSGHSETVCCVSISVDGRLIASGSQDKTVRVWVRDTGCQVHKLEGHSNFVSSVCMSADVNFVISGSYDTTVRVWDSVTGCSVYVLEGHTNWITSVSVSTDGNFIVSGCYDMTVRVWDAATGAIRNIQRDGDPVRGEGMHAEEWIPRESDNEVETVATAAHLLMRGNECAIAAMLAPGALEAKVGDDGSCVRALNWWESSSATSTSVPTAFRVRTFQRRDAALSADGCVGGVDPTSDSVAVWLFRHNT